MKQSDLIQQIIAAEHQAQTIADSAKTEEADLDEDVGAEIDAIRKSYTDKADAYLAKLKSEVEASNAASLSALDQKLQQKLGQVESIYREKKEDWIDTIFALIVERKAIP